MKQSLLAISLLGAFASAAQAQSSVAIYGTLDAGVSKKTDATLAIGKRDNNKLGFKGIDDLGNGLNALFQLEMRYEPDTGTLESGSRPLFQGQSRVGLQSKDFGMLRLGRGLSAFQESTSAFEPWGGVPSVAGFLTDLQVGGYSSDPLGPAGNSGNRFSNALFYNTPEFGGGFQLNATVGSKEANSGVALIGRGSAAAPQYPANAEGSANPLSFSATYKNGPVGAMLAYERNAIDTTLWSIAGAFEAAAGLRLVATYVNVDNAHTKASNSKTRAWVLGANYTVGAGKILAGYGQKDPDTIVKTRQFSLGYEYALSKRSYLYLDGTHKKAPSANFLNTPTFNFYSLGIHHNF